MCLFGKPVRLPNWEGTYYKTEKTKVTKPVNNAGGSNLLIKDEDDLIEIQKEYYRQQAEYYKTSRENSIKNAKRMAIYLGIAAGALIFQVIATIIKALN